MGLDTDVDKLLEAVTVVFPRELALAEVEEFFRYLSSRGKCEVDYTVTKHKRIGNRWKQTVSDKPKFKSVSISGTVSMPAAPETGFGNSSFRSYEGDRCTRIKGIQFTIIPGYSLEEHNQAERALWAYVKQQAAECFSQ